MNANKHQAVDGEMQEPGLNEAVLREFKGKKALEPMSSDDIAYRQTRHDITVSGVTLEKLVAGACHTHISKCFSVVVDNVTLYYHWTNASRGHKQGHEVLTYEQLSHNCKYWGVSLKHELNLYPLVQL